MTSRAKRPKPARRPRTSGAASPAAAGGGGDARPPRAPAILAPALVFALSVVAFWPATRNGFVNWDDPTNIVKNEHIRGLGGRQLAWMFTSFRHGHYQPLIWLTYAIDHSRWGLNAFGFHLTSIVFHAANGVLCCLLIVRLLRRAAPARAAAAGAGLYVAAGLAAAGFAVHPLRAECVAWATERRDVVSGFFFLLTLLAYLRAHEPNARSRGAWLAASLVAYVLALFSKVMVVTLPAVLLVLDVYPLRRLGPGWWFDRRVRGVWLEKLAFVALALPFALLAPLAQSDVQSMPSLAEYGIGPRFTQAAYGLAFYAYKTLLPVRLSPLYELPAEVSLTQPRFLIAAAVTGAITLSLVFLRRRWPAGLAAWVCYALILAPVSGIAQNGPQIAADRYTYLACLGFAVLVAGGLLGCRRGAVLASTVACMGGAIVALVLLTRHQTGVWRDSGTLWRQALAVDPRCGFAHNNLGLFFKERGDLASAIEHYRRAVQIAPSNARAQRNLANALSAVGRLDEAEEHLKLAVKHRPGYAEAYNDLGLLLAARGGLSQAIDQYEQAIRHKPNLAEAHANLANALVQEPGAPRLERAIEHWRRALELSPALPTVRTNLASALVLRRSYREAVGVLEAGLATSPPDFKTVAALAWLLATAPEDDLRDGARAVRLAERAADDDPQVLAALAAAYAEVGRFDDAVRIASQARQLADPLRGGSIGNLPALARQLDAQLSAYEARRPHRLP